jgi:hypothetical protein
MSENVGASTSRRPKGLHGLYGDNFTFTRENFTFTKCFKEVEKCRIFQEAWLIGE